MRRAEVRARSRSASSLHATCCVREQAREGRRCNAEMDRSARQQPAPRCKCLCFQYTQMMFATHRHIAAGTKADVPAASSCKTYTGACGPERWQVAAPAPGSDRFLLSAGCITHRLPVLDGLVDAVGRVLRIIQTRRHPDLVHVAAHLVGRKPAREHARPSSLADSGLLHDNSSYRDYNPKEVLGKTTLNKHTHLSNIFASLDNLVLCQSFF